MPVNLRFLNFWEHWNENDCLKRYERPALYEQCNDILHADLQIIWFIWVIDNHLLFWVILSYHHLYYCQLFQNFKFQSNTFLGHFRAICIQNHKKTKYSKLWYKIELEIIEKILFWPLFGMYLGTNCWEMTLKFFEKVLQIYTFWIVKHQMSPPDI